ncbi:MAG: VOC family protein [Acidobacteriota bacterium]
MNLPAAPVKEIFPYLRVKGAAEAIEFYKAVFGAIEVLRLTESTGRIGHVQLHLGNTVLQVSEEYPEYGWTGPQPGLSGCAFHLHVQDVDELASRAVAAGATMLRQPTDQFYGERACMIRDPFGHDWILGHVIEQISPDEMQNRLTAVTTY